MSGRRPTPDYQRIAQLEHELGIDQPETERGVLLRRIHHH